MHRLNLSIDNKLKSFQVVVKLSFTWPAANVAWRVTIVSLEFNIFSRIVHTHTWSQLLVWSVEQDINHITLGCIYKALDHTSHSMGQLNSICRKPQLATA